MSHNCIAKNESSIVRVGKRSNLKYMDDERQPISIFRRSEKCYEILLYKWPWMVHSFNRSKPFLV